jgi:carbamoyltransferase-like protein
MEQLLHECNIERDAMKRLSAGNPCADTWLPYEGVARVLPSRASGRSRNRRVAQRHMGQHDMLGISAFSHDTAACLRQDGEIVAAAQEEGSTRKKGDPTFLKNAVESCLRVAGIAASDITRVGFYDKPLLQVERTRGTYLGVAPRGSRPVACSPHVSDPCSAPLSRLLGGCKLYAGRMAGAVERTARRG